MYFVGVLFEPNFEFRFTTSDVKPAYLADIGYLLD